MKVTQTNQSKKPRYLPIPDMKIRYEGLLVLNVKGSEETAKEMIERIEGEFKKEGAQIEQVQKIERRNFSYVAGPLDSGYYVNFIFQAEPPVLERLRAKFKLDGDVYRQTYVKLPAKKKVALAKA
jgi:small subunit ribosomal protein S6